MRLRLLFGVNEGGRVYQYVEIMQIISTKYRLESIDSYYKLCYNLCTLQDLGQCLLRPQ